MLSIHHSEKDIINKILVIWLIENVRDHHHNTHYISSVSLKNVEFYRNFSINFE